MVVYYVLQCELFCVPTSGSGFCQWVWIANGSGYENPMGLDFISGSGFYQWVWICQWVWIWKPHGPDSLLYHVIYTQPWHKCPSALDTWENKFETRPTVSTAINGNIYVVSRHILYLAKDLLRPRLCIISLTGLFGITSLPYYNI